MPTQVVTHALEMTDRSQLRAVPAPSADWTVTRVEIPCPELNRFFYHEVGAKWRWIDRLHWSEDRWSAYVGRPELETWVAYLSGTPVGYFELESQPSGDVQLMYFGLLTRFIGRGCGGPLLTAAVERAWNMGAVRVWVQTCSLDHPNALFNYLARGFRVFEKKTTGRQGTDLVIFDCDGVLVDSEPASNRVFVEELRRLGLDIEFDEVCRRFIGLSMARCMEILSEELGRPVPPGFVERLQSRTFEAFRRGLEPVRGVPEMLRRITAPVCVASSGEHEKMRLTLGLTGLLDRFEGRMFSATEVPRGKPHPDLFLHAARCMRARPARCVVVEDSSPGVRAARAAGMTALGYAGRGNGAELASAGARVFDDMIELPGLLERLAGPTS